MREGLWEGTSGEDHLSSESIRLVSIGMRELEVA